MTDWGIAQKKAHYTGRWAETIMKVLARLAGDDKWRFISFRGKNGAESRGVVDVIAIKKNHKYTDSVLKRGDLFEIILIQCKGGKTPRPTENDIKRLEKVKDYHGAKAIVLFEWEKGTPGAFFVLSDGGFPKVGTKAKEIFT